MDDWYENEQLHFAVQDNDLSAIKRLVAEGRDVNAFDELGKTPLHYACEKEYFKIAGYLIEQGADVNAHHEETIGNTPLGDIAGSCSLEMAEFLISHGANPSIRGWMQLDAIDRAKQRKKEEGVKVYKLLKSNEKT